MAEEGQKEDKNKLIRPWGKAHGQKWPISAFSVDLFTEISPYRKFRNKRNLEKRQKLDQLENNWPDSKRWPGKI